MKVNIQGKVISIEKLKLSDYADVLAVIETIPKLLGEYAGKSNDEFFGALPSLIGKALPEIIKILEVATPLSADEIDSLGLDEAVELLKAVFEANGIGRVAKNLSQMFQPKSSQPDSGSTKSSTSLDQNTAGADPRSLNSIPMK